MSIEFTPEVFFHAVSIAVPAMILLFGGILTVGLAIQFASKIIDKILEPLRALAHDESFLTEKPKNETKRKNDDVGFDPFAEDDSPAYIIGDDGELMEVERE